MNAALRLLLVLALSSLPLFLRAETGAALPAPLQAAGWRLQGAGEMRFLGFSLYRAALWGESSRHDAAAPFALVIHYSRDFEGARLVATSEDELRRLGLGDDGRLARWREHMRQAFPDVRAGERITGLYLPGEGVRFYHGDVLTAAVADQEFAAAFFAIWLDPRTRAPELRSQLLGEARDG